MSRQNMDPFGEIKMGEKEPTKQKRKRSCYICNTQKCAAKNRNTQMHIENKSQKHRKCSRMRINTNSPDNQPNTERKTEISKKKK